MRIVVDVPGSYASCGSVDQFMKAISGPIERLNSRLLLVHGIVAITVD